VRFLVSLSVLVASQTAGPVNRGDVNASGWPGVQGEVSIALDRFDSRKILAAAMNLNEGGLLVMTSDDAGETWSRTALTLPSGAAWHADPMVAFDSRGNAYLAVIPVARDNTALGIELSRSDDSGRTWSPPVRISKATGRDDKLALAVDDDLRSRFRDRIQVVWKWPSGGIFYSFSDDGARHFSRPRLIEVEAVSGLDLAVTSEGELYVAASDGEKRVMRVMRSPDGGASFLPSVAVAPVRAEWYTSQPSHCKRQSIVHASIAVDRSEGPHRGTVYLTWADFAAGASANCGDACNPETACTTEVFVSRSRDGGQTWSAPATLPEQLPGSDRYFQWSRVDPSTGTLYVAFKDSRLDRRRIATDVYLSRSTDSGATWEPPLRLSSASSDASGSSFQYGDYQGLAVSDGQVYAAWSDYRIPSDGEIYVGRARFAPAP
jgi:photosystem II stability/assembly factor-like uncharacterized protein